MKNCIRRLQSRKAENPCFRGDYLIQALLGEGCRMGGESGDWLKGKEGWDLLAEEKNRWVGPKETSPTLRQSQAHRTVREAKETPGLNQRTTWKGGKLLTSVVIESFSSTQPLPSLGHSASLQA